nr:thiamine-phosphate kinase [Candidatus Dormibacteraeota bacterium]
MTTGEHADTRRFGTGGATVAEVGESGILDSLVEISRRVAPAAPGTETGDDAAVWTPRTGHDLAVSIDAVVESVDFRRSWTSPAQLGRRAFAVAVSDLAGTGASPLHCVATVCLPPSEQVEDLLEIQRGLCEAAAAAGCTVSGGDLSAIDGPLVIDVCVIGELPSGSALRRTAGRSGDLLVVTGRLGRAAAGLRLLLDEGSTPADPTPEERTWIAAQIDPPLRLREGRQLRESGVTCAGDISDGLAVDAARTARSSVCAAELWMDAIPVDTGLVARFSQVWLQLALGGGEDFELLAAMPADVFDRVRAAWPPELAPLTVVGRLCEGAGVQLLAAPGGAPVD